MNDDKTISQEDAVEEMARRLATVTWGERGPEFVSKSYATNIDGSNSVRTHYIALAKAALGGDPNEPWADQIREYSPKIELL